MASSQQETPSPGYGLTFPPVFMADPGEKTFQFQGDLPSLPVPPLKQTLTKYLDSVKPHLTPKELKKTQTIVNNFETGIGKTLHEKLCEYAKYKRNWLERWWEDYAYLAWREPAAPLVNFSGPGPYLLDIWKPQLGTQLERAAMVIWLTLQFWVVLKKEQFKVDRGGLKEKRVWCMHQFHRMFSSCKTPGAAQDKLNDYFKTEAEGDTPHHITVLCRGRIFSLEILDASGAELLSPREIQAALAQIEAECERQGEGPAIGAMTGGKRDTWYKLREHLLGLHPDNAALLDIVQTSIFSISLDDATPSTMEELAQQCMLGNPTNRWFDKSMCFIFFKNGAVGNNCDHAPHDAMIMVVNTLFCYMIATGAAMQGWKCPDLGRPVPKPKELNFVVDDTIKEGVASCTQVYRKHCDNTSIAVNFYKSYGRKMLRSFKVVPDTHVQLSLQLAYFRLYNKPAPTYETSSTRKYWHGRTETVRSCTPEAMAWAKMMADPASSMEQKVAHYKAATEKHNQLMAEGQEGMGCDRHLFGLSVLAQQEGLDTPEIFTDPAWTKSGGGGNFVLSTSFVGYTPVFGGVLPMCKDGYGVFYAIQEESISIYVSSWNSDPDTDSRRMQDALSTALDDTRALLEFAKSKM